MPTKWGSPPAESESGDVDISLPDASGSCPLKAHSAYLQHASPAFRDSLAASEQSRRDSSEESDSSRHPKPAAKRRRSEEAKPDMASMQPARPVLTLPDTSLQQALLLMHFLYTWARESWLSELQPHELVELARIASRCFGQQTCILADPRARIAPVPALL